MKYLFLSMFFLTMPVLTAIAQEEIIDHSTVTLDNSQTTESLTNESLPPDEKTITIETKKKRPKNKWDFSDYPKSKENKADKTSGKNQNTKKDGQENKLTATPKKKWIRNDTDITSESPMSGKIKRSTYSR